MKMVNAIGKLFAHVQSSAKLISLFVLYVRCVVGSFLYHIKLESQNPENWRSKMPNELPTQQW